MATRGQCGMQKRVPSLGSHVAARTPRAIAVQMPCIRQTYKKNISSRTLEVPVENPVKTAVQKQKALRMTIVQFEPSALRTSDTHDNDQRIPRTVV